MCTCAKQTLHFLQDEEECEAANLAYYGHNNETEFLGEWVLAKKLNRSAEQIETFEKGLDEFKDDIFKLESEVLKDVALFHVYFKELGMVQYLRDELYSIVDFIGGFFVFANILNSMHVICWLSVFPAAVGGIIGLCIGFSILSLIEIIYWFTFRMYNDYVRKDKDRVGPLR